MYIDTIKNITVYCKSNRFCVFLKKWCILYSKKVILNNINERKILPNEIENLVQQIHDPLIIVFYIIWLLQCFYLYPR